MDGAGFRLANKYTNTRVTYTMAKEEEEKEKEKKSITSATKCNNV